MTWTINISTVGWGIPARLLAKKRSSFSDSLTIESVSLVLYFEKKFPSKW